MLPRQVGYLLFEGSQPGQLVSLRDARFSVLVAVDGFLGAVVPGVRVGMLDVPGQAALAPEGLVAYGAVYLCHGSYYTIPVGG